MNSYFPLFHKPVFLFIFFSWIFLILICIFLLQSLLLSGSYALALNMGSENKQIKEGSAKRKIELTFFPSTITLLLLNFSNHHSLLQGACNVSPWSELCFGTTF